MLPRVVIVGAGFGGLQCAKKLAGKPVDVLLIDRNNYHLFTPLLYQVASSLLNPSDIAYPVRAVFRRSPGIRFRVAEVTRVDLGQKLVHTADGASHPWDHLVLAAGSRNNFFGLKSVEDSALVLKDLTDAIGLRSHVIRAFEGASRENDPATRTSWLTFVVVGGGPTGVEYAGALSELINRVLRKDYPELDLSGVRVILVEALKQVLPAFSPALSADALKRLRRLRVDVRLDNRVVEASASSVKLSTSETLDCRTLVWCAGVKPSELAAASAVPVTRSGRIHVDQHLRIANNPNAYAIGDLAGFVQDGKELPMMSPQGTMATIGRHAAVAQVGPLSFKGPLGWFVWLFVHLYYIIGYRNRLEVLLSWGWNYLFYDRPIRLITGEKGDAKEF
jgi:NADH dehydrogenase